MVRVAGGWVRERHAWVTPSHDPSALAEGVLRLATDAELRRELIAGGRRTADAFSSERFVGRVLEVYADRLNGSGPQY